MIMLQACFANEKQLCRKLVCKDERFLNSCAMLGAEISLTKAICAAFENPNWKCEERSTKDQCKERPMAAKQEKQGDRYFVTTTTPK